MGDRELLEVLELFDRNSGVHMCSKSQNNGACLQPFRGNGGEVGKLDFFGHDDWS